VSDFIRVLGEDPNYKTAKLFVYVHKNAIVKAYPVWAEIKDGKAWLCTQDHPGAKLIAYTLVDHAGKEYSCGNPAELHKLGLEMQGLPTRKIGFALNESKKEVAVDQDEVQ